MEVREGALSQMGCGITAERALASAFKTTPKTLTMITSLLYFHRRALARYTTAHSNVQGPYPVQTVFSANGSKLAFRGSTKFSAKGKPGRFEKVAVHPDSDAEGGDPCPRDCVGMMAASHDSTA